MVGNGQLGPKKVARLEILTGMPILEAWAYSSPHRTLICFAGGLEVMMTSHDMYRLKEINSMVRIEERLTNLAKEIGGTIGEAIKAILKEESFTDKTTSSKVCEIGRLDRVNASLRKDNRILKGHVDMLMNTIGELKDTKQQMTTNPIE